MHFEYCPHCGTKLVQKNIGDEGLLPFCIGCEQPFWDMFASSIICAVINEENEIALLRQNYVSTTNYVCVAGMVKMGETTDETVVREVSEELGLDVLNIKYIRSYYYDKKELLMHGYMANVKKRDFSLSTEVDNAQWIPLHDAPSLLRNGGIAWKLVNEIIHTASSDHNINVGVRSTAKAIIRHDNKILLNKCYDSNNGHYYSLPGGGQNKYESIYEAVIRECREETGYEVGELNFLGICEEICDNEDTRTNYSQYAHKFYHIFECKPISLDKVSPTVIDDMQVSCEWIDIDKLSDIRILPTVVNDNLSDLIYKNSPIDMGSIHIPYNHG